jgi:hypothetical protein
MKRRDEGRYKRNRETVDEDTKEGFKGGQERMQYVFL